VTYHALGSVKRRMQGGADTSAPSRVVLERTVGQAATRVIAQCTDEITELRAYGLPRSKIAMVPSGVDINLFSPAVDVSCAGRRPQRVLSVGRLVPRKGFAEMVSALPGLAGVELVIAGGPPADQLDADPEARRLRELAVQVGVDDRLVLLGAVPQLDMVSLYRSCDLLACTPDYEPFGITPLEAMGCGVPVVAYAVGGLKDSVRHGITGVQVRPHDVSALASEIRALLADDLRRRRYGQAATEVARLRYPWSGIATRVAQVYHDARQSHAAMPAPRLGALARPLVTN
jgi:glycosyltransferase involved in cell wall biosynthesis